MKFSELSTLEHFSKYYGAYAAMYPKGSHYTHMLGKISWIPEHCSQIKRHIAYINNSCDSLLMVGEWVNVEKFLNAYGFEGDYTLTKSKTMCRLSNIDDFVSALKLRLKYLTNFKTLKLSDEQLEDIMVTALEGGINYWARHAEPLFKDFNGASDVAGAIVNGSSIRIFDAESEDSWILTLVNLKEAIGRYFVEKQITFDDVDAVVADVIVQYALFSKVVFG